MFKIIPSDDRKQSKVIRIFLMSAGSYLMGILLIFYAHFQGFSLQIDTFLIASYCATAMVTQIIFYIIFRSSFNKKAKDPSLTIPQMVVAIFWITVVVFYSDSQARSLILLLYMVVFIFGVLKLQVYQFVILAGYTLACYLAVICLLIVYRPEAVFIKIEILHCVGLGLVLTWFSFVGGYINRLREKLVEALGIIKKLATHDELTNVYNRRKLFETLQREKALADRDGPSFSVCMFDLDFFKKVNDTYGHLVGDNILKIVARAIQHNLREEDYMARYGGEEFVLILSYPELESTVTCAERLRKFIADMVFPDMPHTFRVTVSFGVTEYRSPEFIEETLARADAALYRAKMNGRNRVEYDKAPSKPFSIVSSC